MTIAELLEMLFKLLQEAFDFNMLIVAGMDIVVFALYVLNIYYGTIIGMKKVGFKFAKFFSGFIKMFGCLMGIIFYCYILNFSGLVLNLTNLITIKAELVTTLEVIGVLELWAIDLAKEVLDKIKEHKELKYVSYDDVSVQKYKEEESKQGEVV